MADRARGTHIIINATTKKIKPFTTQRRGRNEQISLILHHNQINKIFTNIFSFLTSHYHTVFFFDYCSSSSLQPSRLSFGRLQSEGFCRIWATFQVNKSFTFRWNKGRVLL